MTSIKSGKYVSESENQVVSPLAGTGPGGHKPSFRSTKLARRARSFKDDFLEKISQMRSPTNQGLRCSSPKNFTPKSNVIDTSVKKGPINDLILHQKQIHSALTHFRDVISKNKLEMLPGNGTIVLDTVWAINLAVKSCVSENSSNVISATHRMYQSVGKLIKLCDDVLIDGDQSMALDKENVDEVRTQVEEAVKHLIKLVQEKVASQQSISYKTTPRISNGNLTLDMPAQRKSLPDIPLTPRDKEILDQTSCLSGKVRGSHSSESVLRDPSPPPKPPIPERLFFNISRTEVDDSEIPPPLPPKKKVYRSYQPVDECFSSNNSLFNSSLERMSLRSKSPEDSSSPLSASMGSLDSNRSKEEREIKAIMDNTDSDNTTMMDSDLSNVTGWDDSYLKQNSSSFFNQSNELHVNNFFGNRLSNTDSGFVSVDSHRSSSYSKRSSQQSSVSAHWNSSSHHSKSNITSATTSLSSSEVKTETTQTTYTQKTVSSVSVSGNKATLLVERADAADTPPAIPEKQKKRQLQNRQPSPYDNVPDNNMGGELVIACEMHQSQSLCSNSTMVSSSNSIEDCGEPPPLPPKKRHMFQSVAYSVMAYMEMIGNCSHAHDQEATRHSVHMVQGQWTSPSTGALSSTQSCTFSQSSFSSSEFSNKQSAVLQPSNDVNNCKISSVSTALSNGVPPALPPKRTRTKFNSASETPTSPTVILTDENKSLPNLLEHSAPIVTMATPIATVVPAAAPNNNNNNNNNCTSNSQPTLTDSKSGGGKKTTTNNNGEKERDKEDYKKCDKDLMEQLDVSRYLVLKKPEEEGPDIRGGHVDALIIMATTRNGVFTYQEAFLTTYRTFITPHDLIAKLIRRYNHFYCKPEWKPRSREAFALIVRVVNDLTSNDLKKSLQQMLMDFVQELINCGELTLAKALRVKHLEKHEAKMRLEAVNSYQTSLTLCSRSYSLVDFKSEHIAEQMTLLDAELFMKIEIPEVLIWAQEQNEERSPNLTRFTEHFNKMSYWARTKILSAGSKDMDKYFTKFIKIMKHLRKINNYNSYLAILSALDSAPVRRLDWQKHMQEGLKEYCALIDSSSSFRAYRQALAETQPPCIPYIGLVLQDLTFVHIGNNDLLLDGSINFSKRWQQFAIVENMKRFKKGMYNFKKNERIINFFHNFDDHLDEETLWQLSETIKPRKGKKNP